MPPPPQNWFMRLLRLLVENINALVRFPLRTLLFLIAQLKRHLGKPTGSQTQTRRPPPSLPSLLIELPPAFPTPPTTVVCASMVPNAGRRSPGNNPFREYGLQIPRQPSPQISPRASSSSLHPYSFTHPNASRSSQDIGMLSIGDPLVDNRSTHTIALTPAPSPHPSPSPQSTLVASTANFGSSPDLRKDSLDFAAKALEDSDITVYPITPSLFERYSRNVLLSGEWKDYIIPPLTTIFTTGDPHQDWKPKRHPEGALYFFQESECRRVLTDANLYDPETLSKVQNFVNLIFDFLRANNIRLAPDTDLVLDLVPNEEDICYGYYFIDHKSRSLFWLDEFDVMKSRLSIGMSLYRSYEFKSDLQECRSHWELFPNVHTTTMEIINELRDIVLHNTGDVLTSTVSTAPYGLEDLEKILGLINNIEKTVGSQLGGSACIIGRLMTMFVRQRFLNFHGEPEARLSQDQSIFIDGTNKRSFLITFLSPIFFCAPDVHLRTLEKMYVDHVMSTMHWNKVIKKLTEEWQEFTLYSQVLLNANVAFLAIQSVDSDSNSTRRSFTQIASYLSTLYSVGSIIIGLLLVRQHRTKTKDSAQEAAIFLDKRRHSSFGLEILAMVHSLPYALLMWATIFFLVAFSFMCLRATDKLTQVTVGGTWVAIGILVCWCIWVAWETPEWAWYNRSWQRCKLLIQQGWRLDSKGVPIRFRWGFKRRNLAHPTSD